VPKNDGFPPILRSEFEILCKDGGGPLALNASVDSLALRWATNQYPFATTWTTFSEWEDDLAKAKRLWPWVALAAARYEFERSEKGAYDSEPTPKQTREMLDTIARDARSLCDHLARLNTLALRLDDDDAPARRAHLAWLHDMIAQNLISARPQPDDTLGAAFAANFAVRAFCNALLRVEIAAGSASSSLAPELLHRHRTQDDRGIGHLVAHCADIWRAMTGRTPSAHRYTRQNSDKPPFARFVTSVAFLGCKREPSLKEIVTALAASPQGF
jgi:hypothetical protein